ncbi:DUF1963 domain-containing protein [Actinoplanes regularis]|uniref:DUF1963 domain-containing protein n=1 Tax=Actinoplanes regularis TaxID=52697 RepID=UPI002553104D|nr:DUF1963 domain-containing protein [Actinoplanes regularis]
MLDRRNELLALVRAEPPAHVADAFDRLPLRPAIRLTPARPGDPVVGRLGGEADLPIGQEWPLRDDGEPEIFVARLDCAVLSAYEVDLELPGSGTLLFFLPRPEEMEEVVRSGRLTVIYVPEGIATAARQVPSHLRHPSEEYEYPLVALTAQTILSAPGSYNPAMAEDPAAIADLSRLLWREEYNGRYLPPSSPSTVTGRPHRGRPRKTPRRQASGAYSVKPIRTGGSGRFPTIDRAGHPGRPWSPGSRLRKPGHARTAQGASCR